MLICKKCLSRLDKEKEQPKSTSQLKMEPPLLRETYVTPHPNSPPTPSQNQGSAHNFSLTKSSLAFEEICVPVFVVLTPDMAVRYNLELYVCNTLSCIIQYWHSDFSSSVQKKYFCQAQFQCSVWDSDLAMTGYSTQGL